MIKSLFIKTKDKKKIIFKNINNINFFVLNYKQSFYKNNTTIEKFKAFFAHSYIYFFLRIIWRGKAFRVRYFKTKSKFTFNFGHSHWNKMIFSSKKYKFTKLRRQNYLVIFYNRKHIKSITDSFDNLRIMNRYNKRGIKVRTTPYIKRFGKISQVNSSLHSFG